MLQSVSIVNFEHVIAGWAIICSADYTVVNSSISLVNMSHTFIDMIRLLYLKLCLKKKTLWPLFMDGVQLPQGYRGTSRRQFTFYHQVPRKSWYSFDRPPKDQRLSQPWSHPVVLNTRTLAWESSALTTRPSLHKFTM